MTLLNTPQKLLYAQGNTQLMTVLGLVDTMGVIVTTESITGNMIDCNGNIVPGCASVVLSSMDSLGDYAGVFGSFNFYPPVGTGYTLILDGTNTNGFTIHYEIMVEIVAGSRSPNIPVISLGAPIPPVDPPPAIHHSIEAADGFIDVFHFNGLARGNILVFKDGMLIASPGEVATALVGGQTVVLFLLYIPSAGSDIVAYF